MRAALALAILGFAPALLDPFTPLKAAVLRVAGLGLLAGVLAAWWAGSRGARPDAHRAPSTHGRATPAVTRLVDLAVIAWVTSSIVSTLAGVAPRLSLVGEIEQREGLLTTLALAGLYAGTRAAHATPAHARRTLDVVLTCAAIAAGYALIQFAGLDPLRWAGAALYPDAGAAVTRPAATLGNPILLGAVLAAALGVAVARLAGGRSPAWRAGALAVLLGAACVATLSRGAWLAAAAGTLAALATAGRADAPHSRRRAALALATVVLPVGAWSAFVLGGPVIARLAEGAHPEAASLPARIEIARAALALWRSHPWLGTGPDTFGLMFPIAQTPAFWRADWLGLPVHAHSAALQVLATGGVLGVLAGALWLAALAAGADSAWRAGGAARAPALDATAGAAALIVAGALNPVGLAGAAVFVVLGGLLAASARAAATDGAAAARPPRLAIVSGAAVAIGVALAAGPELAALADAGLARDALTRAAEAPGGAPPEVVERAVERAETAARRAPGEDELERLASDAALLLARQRGAAGDPVAAAAAVARAESSARRAVALQPRRASNLQRLANALALRARLARAGVPAGRPATEAAMLTQLSDATFDAAAALAPCDALLLTDRVRACLEAGRPQAALASARRVVALYPAAGPAHALEAAADLALGDRAGALAALRRARAAYWEAGTERERAAVTRTLESLARAPVAR